ncbi:MAG: hypothetical protein A2747_02835 [Candidatus Yonathbacteria bacterium RIFCSPHIGHO2_01_FULL_44_41]|uniref:Uncharacterized protein n=1 Tax=Candidatus Yonathbacteria bacterium RIFCSPHIGHO2_02_FULL_44_14 TaxID=1802724 RepID=A0A1G2S627_9BACT|nr:MAG: hypothetical protein A2747_02835 [Candidatus Yonathbacteria bacterium RIFCSPHIGHO2_01_FULL_44_41]OHA80553.1 MAG: hypothetical protein A3D51_00555 [Candidatus Yonathbacteria bacterium RIFCSPHIGHO2_02_FULL_44_14]OHA82155.1 MAG: hypothetical protein A3B06_01440 [Candidatus Yonathbacteria bacterium RIFCSPLOWO2_01_FULL_43_20]
MGHIFEQFFERGTKMNVERRASLPYARKITPSLGMAENARYIAMLHLVHFWKPPIKEGVTTPQGYSPDFDEVLDPHELADVVDQQEPEAQGGRAAVLLWELPRHQEVRDASCVSCNNIWCLNAFTGTCPNEGEAEEDLVC